MAFHLKEIIASQTAGRKLPTPRASCESDAGGVVVPPSRGNNFLGNQKPFGKMRFAIPKRNKVTITASEYVVGAKGEFQGQPGVAPQD